VLEIITVETPSLGDRSYVATDGASAVVVDPQRDLDRVLAVTEPRKLAITHVLETHVHNDYVTGGLALAREVGADYCLNADDPVHYERHGLHDGDLLRSGELRVRAVATPGHTFTHLAYVVEGDGRTAVFSGG
jgi:glyoxylase-like metal-dependent hydrolase (beta-lactamase superfamily II)